MRYYTPLPEGDRRRAWGYETWEDWDAGYDTRPCGVPPNLEPFYKTLYLQYASAPRYAFVCPCCGLIICAARDAPSFVAHIRDYLDGGTCSCAPPSKKRRPAAELLPIGAL